jgi:hypothetical protein
VQAWSSSVPAWRAWLSFHERRKAVRGPQHREQPGRRALADRPIAGGSRPEHWVALPRQERRSVRERADHEPVPARESLVVAGRLGPAVAHGEQRDAGALQEVRHLAGRPLVPLREAGVGCHPPEDHPALPVAGLGNVIGLGE